MSTTDDKDGTPYGTLIGTVAGTPTANPKVTYASSGDPSAVPHGADPSILGEAMRITSGPRMEAYGHPKENHARTAALWAAYLGRAITPRDVCMLMILLKVSRDQHQSTRDNLVDIAGWARNAEMVEE